MNRILFAMLVLLSFVVLVALPGTAMTRSDGTWPDPPDIVQSP